MPLSTTVSRPLTAFIHLGAWGDLYVSTAALRDVCDRHPEVAVVGSVKWLDLLQPKDWPRVREIWVSEDGRHAERHELRDGRWASTGHHSLRTLFHKVHTSYNLRTESFRFSWAPLLGGVPERHGSAPFPWSYVFYTHRAPWLGKDPRIHERDRLLQVVEAPDHLGEYAASWKRGTGLPMLKTPDRANGERIAGTKAGTYWLFNPTSSRRTKAWPADRLSQLLVKLQPHLEAKGLTWRVIGAPNETDWLRETLPAGFNAKDYVIQTATISDLSDVLSGAAVLVTNASSMQFLAAGFGVRTLNLIGRTDPVIWGPLGPRDSIVPGRIDPELDSQIFEQERVAYESVPVERVLDACLAILNS
ncbi:MAG: glycosyltransferase family 9 protein [Bdellovibrionota bacterium]